MILLREQNALKLGVITQEETHPFSGPVSDGEGLSASLLLFESKVQVENE